MEDDFGYEGNRTGGYSPGLPDNSNSPPKKLRQNQSLIPVTIKQISEATQGIPDDAYRIDGREVNQLTLVGAIRSVAESSLNLTYEVEDGTGLIEVREYVNKDDSEYAASKRSNRREGVYVRVVGLLRSFQGSKHIMAFHIRPITDFNEITHHFLEAIYAHLYNTKGPIAAGGVAPKSPSKPSNLGNQMGRQQPQKVQHHQPQAQSGESLAETILQLMRQNVQHNSSESGMSISEIARAFEDVATLDEVRQAINHLCGEAHIYGTIEEPEEHYALTGP